MTEVLNIACENEIITKTFKGVCDLLKLLTSQERLSCQKTHKGFL